MAKTNCLQCAHDMTTHCARNETGHPRIKHCELFTERTAFNNRDGKIALLHDFNKSKRTEIKRQRGEHNNLVTYKDSVCISLFWD